MTPDGVAAPATAVVAAAAPAESEDGTADRAREFARVLLDGRRLDTGESALAHADGTVAVLRELGCPPALHAAVYLLYASDALDAPRPVIAETFGEPLATLVELARQLVRVQRLADLGGQARTGGKDQTERVRQMLLAFSRDLRVVLLRLASRLQTLRWHAQSSRPCAPALAEEALRVFVPLAGRLGLGSLKWELEDLAMRFLDPDAWLEVSARVPGTRAERDAAVDVLRAELAGILAAAGIPATVQGRAKHLHGVWAKMRRKQLPFERVFDVNALRVVVDETAACYAALARVHAHWAPVAGEFVDYIARPKANGYQSLHTVVRTPSGQPLEVQIRTHGMHAKAEHGVAAHWLYKESGGSAATQGADAERLNHARRAVLRELLAWESDVRTAVPATGEDGPAAPPDRLYVFTPQARVVELPTGATPVDFAYALHTDLGHRCRGATVDGHIVPLNTPLRSGQTVSVATAREGGPSLDWLNPDLGYLASPRARAKVRAWFNARAQAQTVARGREAVERLLQREGRTAVDRQALAASLGLRSAEALFEVVGKDEMSLRTIESLLRPPAPAESDPSIALQRARADERARGGVLVVGVDSLLTSLPRCCRPAPPDRIGGFITRGHGVAVHRSGCSQFRQMAAGSPERVIEVAWGRPAGEPGALYAMAVQVEAADRPGLLRDVSEVLTRERINVTAVQTRSSRDRRSASMTFTVEASDAGRLATALPQLAAVPGVRHARRV